MELSILLSVAKSFVSYKQNKMTISTLNAIEKNISDINNNVLDIQNSLEEISNQPLNTALSFFEQAANSTNPENQKKFLLQALNYFTMASCRFSDSKLEAIRNGIIQDIIKERGKNKQSDDDSIFLFGLLSSIERSEKEREERWKYLNNSMESYFNKEQYLYRATLGAAICSWHMKEYKNSSIMFDKSLSCYIRCQNLFAKSFDPDFDDWHQMSILYGCLFSYFSEAYNSLKNIAKDSIVTISQFENYDRINSWLNRLDEGPRNEIIRIKEINENAF